MKRLTKGILALAALAAAAALTGCDKKSGTTTEGDATFTGTYRMETKPFYSDMEAKDPSATAIEAEGLNMTYAQVIAAVFGLVQSAETGDQADITFGEDGSLTIVTNDPAAGSETVFPDAEAGMPASAIRYAVSGDRAVFTLSSDAMDNMLDTESDPQQAAAIKQLLARFDKGVFVYSAADNSAKVTFKYTLEGKTLTLYIDKGMLSETWSAGKEATDDIIAMVGQSDPATAAILTAVFPQVDAMLEGFNKIEAGARMTKQ